MSFKHPIIPLHMQYNYIYIWRTSPSPLAGSPLLPFVSPSTYLAPSSCDRNRPPPSQVACKLTPFAPPFTQLTHPLQIPRTPVAPRLTMTTSGIFRLLLSGTFTTASLTVRAEGLFVSQLGTLPFLRFYSQGSFCSSN
jgi:hypothetical protein